MEGKDMEGQLSRASLGRVAFIGELYNARTESFSSRSLLKSTFPPDLIKSTSIGKTEFEYRFTNSASERFNLLKVQAELQVGVLIGLVSVEGCGSGSFLTKEEESEKSVCCSLMCNISTVCEKVIATFTEIMHHIDLTALEDMENTHVVTEVNWGTNCLLNLVATATSKSEKDELKGKLSAKLEKLKCLLSAKGGCNLEKEGSVLENSEDTHIKVWADIVPDGAWPTSAEGFCEFMMEVPKLLKKVNDGKGKPLNYVMMPVNTFRRLAKLSSAFETIVTAIDESFLLSTVYLLEDIVLLKRKLNDLLTEMTSMRKYVRDDELQVARKHRQDLAVSESDLKLLISEQWVQVRSGKKILRELIREVESFKSRKLRLYVYEEYLESVAAIREKLAMVTNFISLGVVYLGKGDTFDSLLSQNLSCEFLVLLMSSDTKNENSELHTETFYYFLTEASDPKPNTKYVVVDFDHQQQKTFMNASVSTSRIFHLKGSSILSKDKYAEYKADLVRNFVRSKNASKVVHMTHKPGNRVPLEMICPAFETGTCSTDLLVWTCFRCKDVIEYGFDEFFYCSCGQGPVADMEYRCSNAGHGNFFVEGGADFIKRKLSSLKPLKEMNVLILGCSGAGKSTWINSIVNYLCHETLDRAKEQGVICTIPARFVTFGSTSSEKYVIEIGGRDANEVTTAGQSATQGAHTYSFIWNGRCVRLIDTPGLCDTRGIEQDKTNLRNIIHHIGHLKELHGVCILLKANEIKINPIFSYCLKELLVHLHRDVARNIVFCFTNARYSFYRPGQISAVLETFIQKLGAERELSLGPHNMFCLDNEAFIFLCSLTNPEITYDAKLIESFAQSWEISLDETKRLFETIASFEPHPMKETLSLVSVRSRIMNLTKPIAEISKTIQLNVSTIERKKEEVRASNQTVNELSKKLKFTEIHLESEPLNYPRTVCTSPSCVEYLRFRDLDVQEIEYKTHCHVRCYIENVQAATVNNAALRNCKAIGDNGKCTNCGCGWEKHMHITYTQKRVEKEMVNKLIENAITQEMTEKEKMEALVKELEVLITKYKQEQEFIIQTSVKFGMFLRRNAITVYNDSVKDYMEYLIEEEEKKLHKSINEKKLLQNLKNMLEHYNAEVAVLTEVIKKGENNNEELSLEQVLALERELYRLELTGKDIRKSVECSRSSNERMMQYAETPLNISQNVGAHHKPRPGARRTSVNDVSTVSTVSKYSAGRRILQFIGLGKN